MSTAYTTLNFQPNDIQTIQRLIQSITQNIQRIAQNGNKFIKQQFNQLNHFTKRCL